MPFLHPNRHLPPLSARNRHKCKLKLPLGCIPSFFVLVHFGSRPSTVAVLMLLVPLKSFIVETPAR